MRYVVPPVLLLILCLATASAAADAADAARDLAERHKASVVTLRVVIRMKMSFGGQSQDQEQKSEVIGTVIDPSGLTVASAGSVDPSAALKAMLANFGEQAAMMKVDAEVKETTLILDDGSEHEADLVLLDNDLDLAFVRPRQAGQFTAVPLAPAAPAARALDRVLIVGRLGKTANRAISLRSDTIVATVKGPQPFYVADQAGPGSVGCLAFSPDGAPLGVVVTKTAAADAGGGGMLGMLSMMGGGNAAAPLTIIRPIDQLAEVAEQARQAKGPITPANGGEGGESGADGDTPAAP